MSLDAGNINYGQLRTTVKDWLNRPDISDSLIKDFISLAERKIFRQLRSPMNEKVALVTLAAEEEYILVPSNLLELKEFTVNNVSYKFQPQNIWQSTKPKYTYTRILGSYYTSPTMQPSDKISLNYYYDASGMNDDDESNNILRTCPDLYLYAALVQAESFLINDERIQLWKELYDSTLNDVNIGFRNMDYRGNLVVME